MVKIDKNHRRVDGFQRFTPSNHGKVDKGAGGSFENHLQDKQDGIHQQRMVELLHQIDRLAGDLAKNLNLTDLMHYRRVVKEFLKEATARAYLLQQERGWSRRGARSILITVQKIDAEVEELLHSFTGRRTPAVEVLDTLDKIRGMLVDLIA